MLQRVVGRLTKSRFADETTLLTSRPPPGTVGKTCTSKDGCCRQGITVLAPLVGEVRRAKHVRMHGLLAERTSAETALALRGLRKRFRTRVRSDGGMSRARRRPAQPRSIVQVDGEVQAVKRLSGWLSAVIHVRHVGPVAHGLQISRGCSVTSATA